MSSPREVPTVVLICHEEDRLDRDGLASWLASTMKLAGLLIIRDEPGRLWRAALREIRRVGPLRFLDVVAFRAYARVALASGDAAWAHDALARLRSTYPARLEDVPQLVVSSPNSAEAKAFLEGLRPDIAIARCKVILKRDVFEIPRVGTFVLHPGICPEYRNAHGCFWALSAGDLSRVGLTLLRIDAGVDTGPVYGYFTYPFDEREESHIVIQLRVLLENLDAIRDTMLKAAAGGLEPLDTRGRRSAVWGQPRLSAYLRWKLRARKEPCADSHPLVP